MKNREQLKHKYLDNVGKTCPYCDSDDLNQNGLEADGNVVTQYVECASCRKTWSDIFTLTNVYLD